MENYDSREQKFTWPKEEVYISQVQIWIYYSSRYHINQIQMNRMNAFEDETLYCVSLNPIFKW